MRRFWLILVICFIVIGCEDKDWEEPITVSGVDKTETIDNDDVYNLTISGMNNNVYVSENNRIKNLHISGHNNVVTIGKNTTIETFTISGFDNTVNVPEGSDITFDDSGYDNQLIEQ